MEPSQVARPFPIRMTPRPAGHLGEDLGCGLRRVEHGRGRELGEHEAQVRDPVADGPLRLGNLDWTQKNGKDLHVLDVCSTQSVDLRSNHVQTGLSADSL